MFRCVVSADLMRRAYLCVSKEETRYYLRGVRVEACVEGGALLIATDGSKMIVIRDPQGVVDGEAIVQLRPDMLKALKAVSRESGERVLAVDGERAAVVSHVGADDNRADVLEAARNPTADCAAFQPAGALVDGTYPDWRRVLPFAGKEPVVATFNVEFMGQLGAALSEGKVSTVTVVPSSEKNPATGPHLVFGTGTLEAVGVIMPLRASRDDRELVRPSWVAAPSNIVKLAKSA